MRVTCVARQIEILIHHRIWICHRVQPGVEVRTTTPGKWNKVVLRRHGASGAWQVTANHSDDMYMCVHIQRNALK